MDPAWGGQTAGSVGRLGFAALAASDTAPGRAPGVEPSLEGADGREATSGFGGQALHDYETKRVVAVNQTATKGVERCDVAWYTDS